MDFLRKHNISVKDDVVFEKGTDGDAYYDKNEFGVKLKGSHDKVTVLARKKYVDGEIATLKKYVDDENLKQDVKIDKNTSDIVDLSTRVTTNEQEITQIKNDVLLLDTTLVSTNITLTPNSEFELKPTGLKAIFTVINKKITAIRLYIHELNTTIGELSPTNKLIFNISIPLPEEYSMSTDRGDFIPTCDSGGNIYLTASGKASGFMIYKAYPNNLNINNNNISLNLTLYSNINYIKGSVNFYDLVINII